MRQAANLTSVRTQDPISKHLSKAATTSAVVASVYAWDLIKGQSESLMDRPQGCLNHYKPGDLNPRLMRAKEDGLY